MRTLSLFESGDSDASVSLSDLLKGRPPRAVAAGLDFDRLLTRLTSGGWPGLTGLSASAKAASIRDYAQTVATVDIDAAGRTRDPVRVMRLMRALARSTATEVTASTLARDEASLSRDAVREYIDALARIFVIENQPAWSAHSRSSAALRRDLGFAGQVFESLVVHDLRVHAQPLGGDVFHARDSAGREIDAIIQFPSGRWAGFEVKLGASADTVDAAATGLLGFAANVEADAPVLTVVTGTGPSYRRADGVNVVAMGALAP